VVVLAAGHVLVLGRQRPVQGRDLGSHAGLLRLQSEAIVPLLGGG
jgi:hypothetical protein